MNITQFKLENNQLHRTTPSPARIVAGSMGTDAVQIHFEAEPWADITATAVFQAGSVEVSVPLADKTAPSEIPHEVMAQAGVALQLGVYGVDATGQIVIPTTYAKICDGVLSGTNMEAAEGEAPTESIYAQWVAAVAQSAAEATQAAHNASESLATVEEAVQTLADVTELAASLEQDLIEATASAVAVVEDAAETQIAAVEAVASKAPMLSEGEQWLVWDVASSAYVDTGVPAQGESFTYADFTAEQLAALKGERGEAGATGAQGETGAQGAAFTYEDFTAAQLAALKGERGEAGATGAQGEAGAQGAAFTYEDFTAAQLAALKGEQGEAGTAGAQGEAGAQGAAFTYEDFTAAQLAALKGERGEAGATGAQGETGAQGAAFTYEDFTAAQLAALKGEQGEAGATGAQGEAGAQGAAFTYEDFTAEQLAALKGEQGEAGATGAQGETGAQGAAFTYEDFTAAQLAALKGEQGEAGTAGAQGEAGAQGAAFTYEDFTAAQLAALKGEQGETGATGAQGETGAQGAAFTYEDFTEAQLAALKGEQGEQGAQGEQGEPGAPATNGIATYIHRYDADTAVHTLVGEGENGKFKASATTTADGFYIGDILYPAAQGGSNTIALTEGQWYLFLLDEEAATVNFTNGGSSSSLLNYSIVASATEPENPKENTFWVASDVALGQCYISGNTPTENIEEGDVWLQIDYSAAASIYGTLDLLDDGTVLLEISIAWQYVDEAWVQKPLYMWDGETWISGVLRLFIYDNDGANDTDGTWSGISGVPQTTFRVTPDLYASPTSRSDRASSGGAYLTAMIDFTNYNTLTLDKGSSTSGYVMRLITSTDSLADNLVTSRTAYSWTLTSAANEYTFDVSDIVGTYGLCFAIYRAQNASGNAPITIYNITLSI